jgi:protein phosphatase 1 regulatory subunit 7
MSSEKNSTPPHISILDDDEEGHGSPKTNGTPRSSSGWDGKLRIEKEKEKRAELVNPEAISDPEYSDEEQVLPGQTIAADEGIHQSIPSPVLVSPHRDCGGISTS